jgi:hypothetical protein
MRELYRLPLFASATSSAQVFASSHSHRNGIREYPEWTTKKFGFVRQVFLTDTLICWRSGISVPLILKRPLNARKVT